MSSTPRFVIYLRVSTQEQGKSGLGLEAQATACRAHIEQMGGTCVAELREIASGDDDERPVLAQAIAMARRLKATLLVSKLDRLSRAVALVAGLLRDGNVELVVAECAKASTLELHLRATVAEEERRLIAERTKQALAAAKRRGTLLGSHQEGHWDGVVAKGRTHEGKTRAQARIEGAKAGSEKAAANRRELNDELWVSALPVIGELRNAGLSLRGVAVELNRRGIATPTGAAWSAMSVSRLLARIG
jgi:DNA invertase Pin-like site-specific DNA recombinase